MNDSRAWGDLNARGNVLNSVSGGGKFTKKRTVHWNGKCMVCKMGLGKIQYIFKKQTKQVTGQMWPSGPMIYQK